MRQYVDLTVKVFEENPEMSFPRSIECQLRTSQRGLRLILDGYE